MSVGNWYYFRIDFVDQPGGYPNSSFQIQTRRWKIISSSNWQFLAYSTGVSQPTRSKGVSVSGTETASENTGAEWARLSVVKAMISGIDHRSEIIEAIYETPTRDAVVAEIQRLLGVEPSDAIAVANLQIMRMNARDRALLQQEHDDISQRLGLSS